MSSHASASKPLTGVRMDDERTPLLSGSNEQSALLGSTSASKDNQATGADGPAGDRDRDEGEVIASIRGLAAEHKASRASIAWKIVLTLSCGVLLGIIISAGVSSRPGFNFGKALKKALGGGLSGALAMVLQVFIFMPLRTIMNYQYRFGKPFWVAAKTLFAEGGYGRYYQGISAAIIQAPVSRFGDTASNTFVFAVLKSSPTLDALPSPIKSFLAAIFTAMFRIILTPIDTAKTTLQVQGENGWKVLKVRVRMYGIGSLWYGAVATAAATVVGYFPWFGVYNLLDVNLPRHHNFHQLLIRQTAIGSCASLASDTVSNSLRVVKTYRQVNETRVSYSEAAKAVIAIDGLRGLFFRGLGTRLLANGCQSITFSILWKLFMDLWNKNSQRPLVEL